MHFPPLTFPLAVVIFFFFAVVNFLRQLGQHHSEIITPCWWNLASLVSYTSIYRSSRARLQYDMLPVGTTILSNVLYIQNCLRNTYCLKGSVIGARETVMNKTESLCLMKLTFQGGNLNHKQICIIAESDQWNK